MVDLRSALAFAKQYRTCPPVSMFKDPSWGNFIKEHIAICPYCSPESVERLGPWADLVKSWEVDLPPSAPADQEIRPGQIRFVRSDRAGWRKGLFYNPPGVLVLEKTVGVQDGYRVAQIYHDVSMAAPGDLVVDDGRTGAGDLMVECWNTYSMKGSYLGPVVGRLSEEALAAVTRMEKDVQAMPAWAVKPPPLEEHDVRLYFRELEAEVGFVFASAAAIEIMAEMERPRLAYNSADEMKQEMGRRFFGISWPERFQTLEEGLAAVRLPIEHYALAAADDEHEELAVNFVLVQAGVVKDIRPLRAEILQHKPLQDCLIIGGRILGLPPEQGESCLLTFLIPEGQTMLAAATAKFDWGSGHFTTTFKIAGERRGSLKIAVFCYIDDD
jgi:hypothetical protein